MSIEYGFRWVWTSDGAEQGPGLGTVYGHTNAPMDAYYLPPIPGPMQDFDYQPRYIWSDADKEWQIKPDAKPVNRPDDFWAWNGQERFMVNPDDPDRNSWVLKPDAEPVEQPQAD